jgi:hypothetical protein
MTAQQAMDAAVALEDGQKIAIGFTSKPECECFRIQLYRERTKMQGISSLVRDEAYKIMISRHRHPSDGRYFIFLTKETDTSNACIIDRDGTIKPFVLPPARRAPTCQDIFPIADINWDNIHLPDDDDIPDLSVED